jgi:hypothetical protein
VYGRLLVCGFWSSFCGLGVVVVIKVDIKVGGPMNVVSTLLERNRNRDEKLFFLSRLIIKNLVSLKLY